MARSADPSRPSSVSRGRAAPAPSSQGDHWHLPQALAAWAIPGLGHILIGQRQRGSIIGATIVVLWTAGLLISGITVIDRVENRPWFLPQMLLAPSVVVDQVHQRMLKTSPQYPPMPDNPNRLYEPSYGRVYEQGVLYTALAGLLNLLAIIDVIYRPRNPNPRSRKSFPSTQGGSR